MEESFPAAAERAMNELGSSIRISSPSVLGISSGSGGGVGGGGGGGAQVDGDEADPDVIPNQYGKLGGRI